MQAEQSLQQGQPETALHQLQDQIKKEPANPKLRVFLFQLLAVLGQWPRALSQLKVAGDLDPANLLMVQTYREAIQCEALRTEIFVGKRSPLVFGEPQQWLAQLIQALSLEAAGHYEEASALRMQAFEAAPATTGSVNGCDFQWIADADTRLGPILEVIVNGCYYWVPFCRVSKIILEPPSDLRDMVWMPAHITWANGGDSVGLLPTRYPGSELASDPALSLGRKTEWLEPVTNEFHGLGQRILTTDCADYSLCDIRELLLNPELT